MPIFNLFRNCAYYWGFAAYVSYFVNHPRYTAPNEQLSLVCLALAMVAQLGNLRCAKRERHKSNLWVFLVYYLELELGIRLGTH